MRKILGFLKESEAVEIRLVDKGTPYCTIFFLDFVRHVMDNNYDVTTGYDCVSIRTIIPAYLVLLTIELAWYY